MQIDMHYYGTYSLARAAGLTREASRIIATSAQFVDDNAKQGGIDLSDASSCQVEATAHHTTSLENLDITDQRNVWVPFHFLPGDEGDSFTERLICRKDSKIAREMCDNHLTQSTKPYFLELLGVMAHVYADTFAHYGFSGVSSRRNRVEQYSFEFKDLDGEIKDYIVTKKNSVWDRFNPIIRNIKSSVAESVSNALGHGSVVTFPDRPYLHWSFEYELSGHSGWRDNVATFTEYCEKIHQFFVDIANSNPDWRDEEQQQSWEQLKPKVVAILQYQAKGDDRIVKWQQETEFGELFNAAEAIPVYSDWNVDFEQLETLESEEAMSTSVYKFYQAASYHRWYVLRELLPKYGLMVV
ncbi:hypothetical protein CWO27_07710 [Vibrio sp. 10N.286.51.C3]|uniref:DUF6765 family protein n=1 Tax=Vibrio TaxID=662 RepID=UPI000D348C45|nr:MULTISPECIES: DUF6765 family protein [Vibrio]MCY9862464.1 hypothetical protein [Vibrio coralliirubri]MEC7307513.1 hypothetical protein [Vibrio crassostreae]PTP15594.1 hypothetical protein CWO27_07710 [Vibrio sp. 10N.286.51.C3]TKE63342.1 hypothetical protein FCV45_15165 [Vibrio sp. F12]TKG00864.1 hypothetical protein FCV76_13380 [Vibrio sp. F13]